MAESIVSLDDDEAQQAGEMPEGVTRDDLRRFAPPVEGAPLSIVLTTSSGLRVYAAVAVVDGRAAAASKSLGETKPVLAGSCGAGRRARTRVVWKRLAGTAAAVARAPRLDALCEAATNAATRGAAPTSLPPPPPPPPLDASFGDARLAAEAANLSGIALAAIWFGLAFERRLVVRSRTREPLAATLAAALACLDPLP